jgi:hypothetical protein
MSGAAPPIDFDLHGAVGIRLVDATDRDAAVVRRQLGPIERPLEREPDIVIRFLDRLERDSPIRLLGLRDVGFTDEAFLVLRTKFGSTVRVRIPFDRIGGSCEILCERGLPAVPYLVAIVNLTALGNGRIPVHASAFVHDGLGVLVTGWAKGGKTEALLGFMTRGAVYIGDEWVYIDPASGHMAGLPEPMRVWDWQLRLVPGIADRVPARTRAGLRATRITTRAVATAAALGPLRRTAAGRTMARALPVLERQLNTQVPPGQLFGGRVRSDGAPLDRVLLVVSTDRPETTIRPIDPAGVARRCVFSLEHERLDLVAAYLKFRYAFPEATNVLLEGAAERERSLLTEALSGRPTLLVEHPYPPDISELTDAIAHHLR